MYLTTLSSEHHTGCLHTVDAQYELMHGGMGEPESISTALSCEPLLWWQLCGFRQQRAEGQLGFWAEPRWLFGEISSSFQTPKDWDTTRTPAPWLSSCWRSLRPPCPSAPVSVGSEVHPPSLRMSTEQSNHPSGLR